MAVAHLRHRVPRNPAMLSGVYQLSGHSVLMQLRPVSPTATNNNNVRYVRGRRVQTPPHDSGERTFHVVCGIVVAIKKHWQDNSWRRNGGFSVVLF
jgi:hypothetical protein